MSLEDDAPYITCTDEDGVVLSGQELEEFLAAYDEMYDGDEEEYPTNDDELRAMYLDLGGSE